MNTNRVLICDVGGQPHHWASWQDGVVLRYKNLLSHEIGDLSRFNGGTNRISGERSHVNIGEILFLKESLKYDSRVPPLTNQNLFARDRNLCCYCGRHYHESKLSRDHIVPVSRGGKNTWNNVVAACKSCNHEKDDNLLHEVGMKLLFLPYVPSHAERLILANRKILVSQMDFLQAMLPANSRLLDNSFTTYHE